MRHSSLAALALLVLSGLQAPGTLAREATPAPAHGVIAVQSAQLDPQHWINQLGDATAPVLTPAQIGAQNQRLVQQDDSVRDLSALPASFDAAQVREWIQAISRRPTRTLYDEAGVALPPARLDELMASLALEGIPAHVAARYALVVHRADLRAFPTRQRVFSSTGDTDIDRFQESALFPGTPAVIVHESRDGEWAFVVSPLYAAWVEKRYLAEGDRDMVLAYPGRSPSLVVTGATAHTVHTPEQPQISELQLDMGVRVPLLADWPPGKPVNGQSAYAGHVVELPIRSAQGRLQLVPAVVPRTADVATDYLPLNQANLIRQGFKFLGERYGWGHGYNTRDCSGFVSEVYRSFGVVLPRNTSDQAVSPALNRVGFDKDTPRAERMKVVASLQVGDLVYIPGHVMMVIGKENGMTYLIHDTTGISYRGADGKVVRTSLNSVSVTPLEPLLFNQDQSYIDRITSIQRIRP